jgi:hypothetical protein
VNRYCWLQDKKYVLSRAGIWDSTWSYLNLSSKQNTQAKNKFVHEIAIVLLLVKNESQIPYNTYTGTFSFQIKVNVKWHKCQTTHGHLLEATRTVTFDHCWISL